jgi:zinc-ribbon domain
MATAPCREDAGMFCTKCGRELPGNAVYCSSCGAPAAPADSGGTVAGSGLDEVGLFVGKNAEYYKAKFRKFDVRGVESFAPTWNWAAFFFTFWWMLYRKLYLWSFAWFVLTFIPYFGLVFWIAAGIAGNYLYYRHAAARIRDARSAQASHQLPAVLTELGGVNGWVIPVAIVVTLMFLLLFAMFGIGVGLFYGLARKGASI